MICIIVIVRQESLATIAAQRGDWHSASIHYQFAASMDESANALSKVSNHSTQSARPPSNVEPLMTSLIVSTTDGNVVILWNGLCSN
jgi:hypothetical protein